MGTRRLRRGAAALHHPSAGRAGHPDAHGSAATAVRLDRGGVRDRQVLSRSAAGRHRCRTRRRAIAIDGASAGEPAPRRTRRRMPRPTRGGQCLGNVWAMRDVASGRLRAHIAPTAPPRHSQRRPAGKEITPYARTAYGVMLHQTSQARNRDRTGDLILTKDVLYRLSYACGNDLRASGSALYASWANEALLNRRRG